MYFNLQHIMIPSSLPNGFLRGRDLTQTMQMAHLEILLRPASTVCTVCSVARVLRSAVDVDPNFKCDMKLNLRKLQCGAVART
jgi:hypothetical protein